MITDDPVTSILLYLCLAGLLIVVAPFLLWIAGEIGRTITDLLPLAGEWYKEQWRRARDAWRR